MTRWLCICLLGLAAFASAQNRPPTLDPTYGMPLPKLDTTPPKLPQDAEWVWTRETKDNQTVWFRKPFEVAHTPGEARLYMTADNYFTVYVNGKKVGQTGPDTGDNSWAKVQKYDVKNELTTGTNVIAVVAVNQSGPAGLLVRLELDGKPALLSDWTWHQMETEPPSGWMLPSFKEEGWTGALRIAAVNGEPWGAQLKGWPVPVEAAAPYLAHLPWSPTALAMLQKAGDRHNLQWKPTGDRVSLNQPEPNTPWEVVFDFSKELTGRIKAQATSNAQVTVGTGESAEESIERPWTTTTLDLVANRAATTNYTALRYAAFTFPAGVKHVDLDVEMDHLYYPVVYRGSFDCSDPLLTRIWYMGAYTVHSCMQEDIWDAPKRDRMRWMGDLHVSGEVINNVFADKFLMEQTMSRLRADAQGGKPMNQLPNTHVNDIPGYSCAWIGGLADFYRHVGDKAYLKSQHDALVSMLEYFRTEFDDQGLFANKRGKWPFVDWAPHFDKDSPETRATTQMFFVKALREAVFMFNEMGDSASAEKYSAWADEVQRVARGNLMTGDTFGEWREENAMAIYSGVADQDNYGPIWDRILQPSAPAWKAMASPYYDNYVIFAMSMAGHTQEAMDFVRSFWGGMLAEGATTCWEAYDPSWDKDNFHIHLQADDGEGYFVSLCHGWSAGCTDFLTERVLGVRSTGGGFKTCEIAPELGSLAWATGEVPTPNGNIKVKVEKGRVSTKMNLTVPQGVSAQVAMLGQGLTVNGKAAGNRGADPNRTYATLSTGTYVVEAR